MCRHLFVYGTLHPNRAPSGVANSMRQLRRVGAASVRGRLYDLGEYPGAVLDSSSDAVIAGEVFEVPDDPVVLQALDEYEGFDPSNLKASLFVRTACAVKLADGRSLASWIYIYNQNLEAAPLIVGGDYLSLRTKKP